MAVFLRTVAVLYLIFVWIVAFMEMSGPMAYGTSPGMTLLIAVSLSIPAAILFGFGQLMADVAEMNAHLAVIRQFFEAGKPASE